MTPALSDACECTTSGYSGGVDTSTRGCRLTPLFPESNLTNAGYCYVSGGSDAKCPCTKQSKLYPGAAYRLCATSASDLLIEGAQEDSVNGYYTLEREFSFDDGQNCGFNPIYQGPTVSGVTYSFVYMRSSAFVRSQSTPLGAVVMHREGGTALQTIDQLFSVIAPYAITNRPDLALMLFQLGVTTFTAVFIVRARTSDPSPWLLPDIPASPTTLILGATSAFSITSGLFSY